MISVVDLLAHNGCAFSDEPPSLPYHRAEGPHISIDFHHYSPRRFRLTVTSECDILVIAAGDRIGGEDEVGVGCGECESHSLSSRHTATYHNADSKTPARSRACGPDRRGFYG